MSTYKIKIAKATDANNVVTEVEYNEKTSGEAKAMAYVKAKDACAGLADGEYVCTLYVKQMFFGNWKNDGSMHVFGVRVSNGVSKLTVSKMLFGGEKDAIDVLKKTTLHIASAIANGLVKNERESHGEFIEYVRIIKDNLQKLCKIYDNEHIVSQYSKLIALIDLEVTDELSSFDNDRPGNPQLYISKRNKSLMVINTTVQSALMNLI